MRNMSKFKWMKTSSRYECPARNFLFDSIWISSPLREDGIPFIDKALYEKTMHEYKDSLKKVGVIIEFGKGHDIIVDHHIQMHQGFKEIARLCKYLQASKWKPHHSVQNLDSRHDG